MELFYVTGRTFFVRNLWKRSVFPYFRTFLNFFGQNEWHICFSQPILRKFPKSDFGHWSTRLKWDFTVFFVQTFGYQTDSALPLLNLLDILTVNNVY